MMSLLSPNLPLADLLKESGVQPSILCSTAVQKASDLLSSKVAARNHHPNNKDEYFQHNAMLQCMETLLILLPQIEDEETMIGICKKVVYELCDPYLNILSADSASDEQVKLASCMQSVGALISVLLQNNKTVGILGSDIVSLFTTLFANLCDVKTYEDPHLKPSQRKVVNSKVIITVLNCVLGAESASKIEKNGFSLSALFDSSLQLLKHSDLQTCYLVAGLLLPLLITPSHPERVEQIWRFIVQVGNNKLCVNSLNSDLILTVLCCFSNAFIHYDKLSPFSSFFPDSLAVKNVPLFDVRKEAFFWKVVQDGLMSADQLSRKRCMYLVQSVLASVRAGNKEDGIESGSGKKRDIGGSVVMASEGWVFWWNTDFNEELSAVWSDFVLILDTMEEKQIHIVNPVRKHLRNIFSATAKSIKGHSLLHVSWLTVALSRVFEHTEAKSIIRWGVYECLTMSLDNSPLLLQENWKFIFGRLLQVLNLSMIYSWDHNGRYDDPPAMVTCLSSFLQRFIDCLTEEDKGTFLTEFLATIANMNFVDVPLVFVTYSLAQLPTASLLGSLALSHIRSIIFNGILTHKPSLRTATQNFLLNIFCQLTKISEVTLEDVIQTVGAFRDTECLIIGTKAWNQVHTFFLQFCEARIKTYPEVFQYLQKFVLESLTERRNPSIPGITHLARIIVLLAEEECRNPCAPFRVLSSNKRSLKEAMKCLLLPVLDIAVTAYKRPYLSPEIVQRSLEMINAMIRLVLQGWRLHKEGTQKADTGPEKKVWALLYASTEEHLPNILNYVVEQLYAGSKGDGIPSLDHVTFHLELLDNLYLFMLHYGYPFHSNTSLSTHSISSRAVEVLWGLLTSQSVELSARFLGVVSLLHWACSRMDPSQVLLPVTSSSSSSVVSSSNIACLPLTLVLVKEKRTCDSSDVSTGLREQQDWGALVNHCYSSYWECLLFYLKCAPTEGFGREERVILGSADVREVVRCCLDNLDVAGTSVGAVIECIALIIPKFLALVGTSPLLSCVSAIWPLVMELETHQKAFWRALRAYLTIVFHPKLFLELSSDSDILELEWKCANDFLVLGESKTKVYNILVDHVLEIWEEVIEKSISAGFTKDCSACLFKSLTAHCKMLLQMSIFGPSHKKNLRNIEELELYLESLQNSSFNNVKFTRHLESNASVRVRVVTFLITLVKRYSKAEETIQVLFKDFLESFVSCLLQQIDAITATRRQYYVNSITHRTKLRLLQTLLVITDGIIDKSTGEEVCKRLLYSLQSDNQLSVRYLMEWVVVVLLIKFPCLLDKRFYQLLDYNPEFRLSRMCSVVTIAMHVGCCIEPLSLKVVYYERVLSAVLQWTSCYHSIARLYSQLALFRMWEDCKKHNLVEVISHFQYVEVLVNSMELNGDGAKFCHKMENNVFFSKIDAIQDRNVETIFYTLPLLCGVVYEEVIPLKIFKEFLSLPLKSEGRGENILIDTEELKCSNQFLLEALEHHWDLSCAGWEDRSDSRSLAHHFKSDAFPVELTDNSSSDVQKKITFLSNPSVITRELFPHDDFPSVSSGIKESTNQKGSGLVLVASLISKIPNLGGLCRTCEIFSVQGLVLSDLKVLEEKQFQNLSVTSEKWLSLHEVKLNSLREYLLHMRHQGYAIVGVEQTMNSKCASKYQFMHQTVLVLGNEREGIPPEIIHLLDDCIEIPQFGTIRSLNVHVSASILIWEYTKQHLAH